MQYRGDVDGLRAIAITAIVLYHAGRIPDAGFLGVDIFFVISGFLITAMIAPKIAEGQFSLLDFYRRRVVRILPALLTMIVLVCAVGCFLLLPFELRGLGDSAVAAAGFASNFYFWGHTNYFGTLDVNPLLHTWSLGVEEQFYVLYPLFLFAMIRWLPRHARTVLAVAALGSAALAWWVARDHSNAAFYLLPTRAWELALGGLVALEAFPAIASRGARQVASGAGLAVVLLALVVPLPLTGMPVPAAIPACLGTALLIAYGSDTLSGSLLSLPPMRWLGRISYSLYLWHWPIIEFYRGQAGRSLAPLEVAGVIAAGLVAALLSYWLVEQPIRTRFKHRGRVGIIVAAGVGASMLVAAGAAAMSANADRIRPLPPEVARIAAYADYSQTPDFTYQFGPVGCQGGTVHFDAEACLKSTATKRNVIVLGDSHAAHLWRAIAERFPQHNVMQANSTECRPLIGTRGSRLCREMVERALAVIAQPGKVQGVVLSGEWQRGEIGALAPTIRALRARGVDVTVIGPGVRYRTDLPLLLVRAMLRHDPGAIDKARNRNVAPLDQRMRAISEAEGARYYSLYGQQCPGGTCRLLTRGGVPIQFDQGHFTLAGAREIIGGLDGI